MDIKCAVCNQTTHDGEGHCLFCRTPFPNARPVPSSVGAALVANMKATK